ncbi:hypothetical protein CEE45_07575 [Candidatus Heimdallarchaeota archaeon B3_Heim]|nr:MAG: hypothetical protein CEE45_07575 [Candidatus Heimdallarchaeota archaeon B3_Heim]
MSVDIFKCIALKIVYEMPTICICLANDPILSVFAFKPGEKINIHVAFESEQIPGRYRLQILDHKKNSRMNRYGIGLTDIVVDNWPIPVSIRDDHLGIWQVKVDGMNSVKEVRSLGEEGQKGISFSQIFFVEKTERVEYPLLGGDIIYQLPEILPIVEEEIIGISDPVVSVVALKEEKVEIPTPTSDFKAEIPITEVRGIGKTYTGRLAQIKVITVSDLWNYRDRINLAEIMRINDKRLEKMLQDAELLLSEKADEVSRIEVEKELEFVPDDLRMVKGITTSHINQLKRIGVKSKTNLLDFQDITLLKGTLRVSTTELSKMLASIGRIIEPESVRKQEPVKPLDQPVTVLKGIGKVTAGKLQSVGILTVQDLLNSSVEDLGGFATKKTYHKWKQNASHYAQFPLTDDSEVDDKSKIPDELLSLPGIGPKTVGKLHTLKIFTLLDLIVFEESERLRKVLRMSESRFTAFMEKLSSNG